MKLIIDLDECNKAWCPETETNTIWAMYSCNCFVKNEKSEICGRVEVNLRVEIPQELIPFEISITGEKKLYEFHKELTLGKSCPLNESIYCVGKKDE